MLGYCMYTYLYNVTLSYSDKVQIYEEYGLLACIINTQCIVKATRCYLIVLITTESRKTFIPNFTARPQLLYL